MKKVFFYSLINLLFLLFTTNAVSTEITYGEIVDNVYKNAYFNMSVEIPEDWAVQSNATLRALSSQGKELIAGEDKNLNAILSESEKQTVNLFGFAEHELGTPVDFNANIMAVAERVSLAPGIKRGSDYLFHVKNILNAGQLEYSFSGEVSSVNLSGVTFDILQAQLKAGTLIVNQTFYAARFDEYVLGFVLSYTSDEQFKKLDSILQKVSFDN